MTSTRQLPPPHASVYDWQWHAACRTVSSALFFAPVGERAGARREREGHLRRLPRANGLSRHALDAAEPYGVWGRAHPRGT